MICPPASPVHGTDAQTPSGSDRWTAVFLAIMVLSALAVVTAESTVALAITLMDGVAALAVIGAAGLAGGWMMSLLGLGGVSRAERLILGAGAGIGCCSILVFVVGCAGVWGRPAAVMIALIVAAAAVGRLWVETRPHGHAGPAAENTPNAAEHKPGSVGFTVWLWLLVGPFLAITLLGACLPPGILWREEGGGYDILEYHLAVPKIWNLAGAISFLSHNVYSNFPQAGEMLSMWMMALRGDPIEAAFMAQFVNVGLAVLFVAAAWCVGRQFSARAALIAGVLAGCTPWLVYLSAIAYVETGMLALGMCALAAVLRIKSDAVRARRWSLLAGLLTGLTCGFKYPAVPFIAVPAAVLLLIDNGLSRRVLERLTVFMLTALAAFSPWMIRNTLNTGNPVFPLAWSVFGARPGVWDDQLEARWQHAHSRASDAFSDEPVLADAWRLTLGDSRIGWITVLLAACALACSTDRRTWGLAAVLALQMIVWLCATHLFARFAVVMLIPLTVLAARGADAFPHRVWRLAVLALLVAGIGANLYRVGLLYYDHTRPGQMWRSINAFGRTAWFTEGQWPGTVHFGAINALPRACRVMLVGEARTYYLHRPCDYAVVFNHHPLALAARKDPSGPALVAWMQRRGITHLLVHWSEIRRLQATYGMDPEINVDLFKRLIDAGLEEAESFQYPGAVSPYATLFEVPMPHEVTTDE